MTKRNYLPKPVVQSHMWDPTYNKLSKQCDVHLFYNMQTNLQDNPGYLFHVQLFLKLAFNEFGKNDENE